MRHFAIAAVLAILLSGCQAREVWDVDNPHGTFLVGDSALTGPVGNFDQDLLAAVPDPQGKTLLIYNHGTENGGHGQECDPHLNPSYLRGFARQHEEVVIYYLCSQEVSGPKDGGIEATRAYKRGKELSDLLNRFAAHGFPPQRTFVLGHSGGASSTMALAARAPEKFNAFVITSPGYGYAYTGESRDEEPYATYYREWREHMLQGRQPTGIVYGFVGDEIAPPEDIAFFDDMENAELRIQEPKDCGMDDPHGYPWSRCFRQDEGPKIWRFIQSRRAEAAK